MTSPFKKEAKKLHKAGYSPVPLLPRDKRAYLDNWSKYCVKRMGVSQVKTYIEDPEDLNIGVALGPASNVIALDFDDDVDGLHAKIIEMLPDSPVKKVGKRGFTVFFKYSGEKNRSWKIKKNGVKITVLELLSEGRQTVVPPSVHPEGGEYQYETLEGLSDVSPEDLPELPPRFSRELDAMFGSAKEAKSEIDMDIREIKEAIKHISADDYEDWIHVGMAIKFRHPTEEAYQVWDEWSRTSEKYDPSIMQSKWSSFKREGIGLGTILYLAFQNGYEHDELKAQMKEDTMKGFVTLDQVEDDVDTWRFVGRDKGSACGVAGMDNLLHFRKGETTVISGYGNAGKSEFLDSVITGLMKGTEDWRFAIASMEKFAHKHYDDLIHKYVAKPREDMSIEEYRDAKKFLRERIVMINYNDLKRNFDKIMVQVRRYMKFGVLDGLVIDPFNLLVSEYKYTNQLAHVNHVITRCTDIAKELNIHVFIVAHPTKPDTTFGKLPKMTKYSIAGGADWVNVADNIVIVSRDAQDQTGVLIDKVRDQEFDSLGEFKIQYDKYTRGYNYLFEGEDDGF